MVYLEELKTFVLTYRHTYIRYFHIIIFILLFFLASPFFPSKLQRNSLWLATNPE